jgi:hypothetical protein
MWNRYLEPWLGEGSGLGEESGLVAGSEPELEWQWEWEWSEESG